MRSITTFTPMGCIPLSGGDNTGGKSHTNNTCGGHLLPSGAPPPWVTLCAMAISQPRMKQIKRIGAALLALVATALALIAIETLGGQPMGLFSGSRPDNLGFRDGKFAPPPWKPNCVSSTVVKDDKHYIPPLPYSGSAADAWKKLEALVAGLPRTHVVTQTGQYLYVEFKTATMGFVDDVEFALDEKTSAIQVRSASRLGVRDFNVNRERVERIRSAFAAA